MKKFILMTVALSAALVACGGGGDSDTVAVVAPPAVSTNAFDADLGTYKSGCADTSNRQGGSSQETTLVLSAPEGADKAKIVVTNKFYDGSSSCAGTLTESLTASGQLTASTITKNITSGVKVGVAKSATFTYESLTFFKGSFTLPALGATTKVGYLIEGGNLYGLSGSGRDANGLADAFSRVKLTKQ